MKHALIFGVGGQDGSYLAELLLEKGYEVHGTHRRSSVDNLLRLAGCRDRVTLHRCDLSDALSVVRTLESNSWDEIYNMADQDEVGWSRDTPGYSVQATYGGPATILEWLRQHGHYAAKGTRFYQPISATVFGTSTQPMTINSPLRPASPYACAKAATWLLCQHYRREHGVDVRCGVLFNHDSPRRGPDYLLQQIARQAIEVARGRRERIELRGPDALVEVGWAPEYVERMWRQMQDDGPGSSEQLIGNGLLYRISDLCRLALKYASGGETERYHLVDPSLPDEFLGIDDLVIDDDRLVGTAQVLSRLIDHHQLSEQTR